MNIPFEQQLNEQWATHRTYVLDVGIHWLSALRAGQAVRPNQAMIILGVSAEKILDLLAKGVLPAPDKWGGGRVAWRADEIAAAQD